MTRNRGWAEANDAARAEYDALVAAGVVHTPEAAKAAGLARAEVVKAEADESAAAFDAVLVEMYGPRETRYTGAERRAAKAELAARATAETTKPGIVEQAAEEDAVAEEDEEEAPEDAAVVEQASPHAIVVSTYDMPIVPTDAQIAHDHEDGYRTCTLTIGYRRIHLGIDDDGDREYLWTEEQTSPEDPDTWEYMDQDGCPDEAGARAHLTRWAVRAVTAQDATDLEDALRRCSDTVSEAARARDALIRQARATGMTQARIAELTGLSQQRVSQIVRPA